MLNEDFTSIRKKIDLKILNEFEIKLDMSKEEN